MAFGTVKLGQGRRIGSGITSPPKREERIADIRQTIKINEYLIRYYQDLINPNSTCSFEVYKAELDKEQEALTKRQDFLQRQRNAATNGEIPSLQKANEVLQSRLKKLYAATPAREVIEARKRDRKIKKAKSLREKLVALERELKDDGFNISDL